MGCPLCHCPARPAAAGPVPASTGICNRPRMEAVSSHRASGPPSVGPESARLGAALAAGGAGTVIGPVP
eukprot:519233-Alexandrium_andersonii.AAC.1